jgi:hypothetical protein
MRRWALVLIVATAALSARPPGAAAQASDFLPRITSLGGSLEFGALRETQSNGAARTAHVSDTYLAERIALSVTGWVYHPRFLLFLAKGAFGLAHEDVGTPYRSSPPAGMQTTDLEDYELRTLLLPEHPYNLELFTVRRNPFQRGRIYPGSASVGTDTGAVLRLRDRPWAANLSAQTSTESSSGYHRGDDTISGNAVYFKDWGNIAGSYSRVASDSSFAGSPSSATAEDYTLENQLRFLGSRATLVSAAGRNLSTQRSFSESDNDDRASWTERLSLALPLSFDVNLTYDRYDEWLQRQAAGAAASALRTRNETAGLSVVQRLYHSLTTTYDLSRLSTSSSTGDTRGTTQALSEAYVKQIPGGLLSAGLSYGKSSLDRTGAVLVLSEEQAAPLFGEFTLRQPGADPASVGVRVKSPATGVFVALSPGINFDVAVVGDLLRVRITALPASARVSDPLFAYSFSVTYSLPPGDTTIDTTTWGGSLRVELFDHVVSPYLAYADSSEHEFSGPASETVFDTTTSTLGLQLQWAPATLVVENQVVHSDINPYRRWRAQLDGRQGIGGNTIVQGQLLYISTSYGGGLYQGAGFDEVTTGATLRVQQRWPRQNVTLLFGGSYTHATGLATHQVVSADAEATWVIRLLEVSASASLGRSELTTPEGRQESVHQLYLLKVTRKLF